MTDLSKGRVILTYGRSLMALTAARSLGKRGVEIIGTDDVRFNALSFSRWVKTNALYAKPGRDRDAFLDDLERIVRDNRPDDGRPYVLMPMFDDAKTIAAHRERFAPHIAIAAPPIEAIRTVDPKDNLARTLTRLQLPAPASFACDTEEEMQAAAASVSYPCLVKPADAVGGRGITKATDPDAVRTAWRTIKENFPGAPVVQAFAPGKDYCYAFLARDGAIVADMAYRNLMSYPADYGAGVVRETVHHHRFREVAAPLIREARWTGVAEIDFMWSEDPGKAPLLIEVNPRFWANLDHSVASGIDFPWLLYETTATGRAPVAPEPMIGHRTKLPGLWLLSALEQVTEDRHGSEETRTANAEIRRKLENGNVREALKAFSREPTSGFGLRQAFRQLKETIRGAEQIETIAVDQDDPLVGLGVLFVVGSLMRYGELPPELHR